MLCIEHPPCAFELFAQLHFLCFLCGDSKDFRREDNDIGQALGQGTTNEYGNHISEYKWAHSLKREK